ncbi:expressed unknown protein [Seminavis robusta]|uniref:Uncharacterized protein n=1 Tax=Seminavis robusta TaxID=568900 RepID=A0A9N8H0P2_9STRA|nr:expressed unknown protein [Seminavis robusta]|eukprot:Sro4_g003660.1 n/a (224) ;mRNA; f:218089-218892
MRSQRNTIDNAGTHQMKTESKVHAFLASQRRNCDEMQRAAARAKERRDMLGTQRDAEEKAVNALKEQLDKDKEQIDGKAEERLERKRMEHKFLEREYDFQHSELVNKRHKLDNMKKMLEEDRSNRALKLSKEQEAVRGLREYVNNQIHHNQKNQAKAPKLAMKLIQFELNGEFSEWGVWAKVLQEKAKATAHEVTKAQRKIKESQAIVNGYETRFGGGDNDTA